MRLGTSDTPHIGPPIQGLEPELAYWKQRLAALPLSVEVPTTRTRPPVPSGVRANVSRHLPPVLVTEISVLCKQEGATLFVLLLAAFQTLLCRYTGQTDVIVGTPVERGPYAGSMLPLRTDLSGDPSFRELLARVREVVSSARTHEDVPVERLWHELREEQDKNPDPTVRLLIALRPNSESKATSIAATSSTTSADACLWIDDGTDHLHLTIEYDADLFDNAAMTRVLDHCKTLLEAIVAQPNERLSRLEILTDVERHQLLIEWNAPATDDSEGRCIHELIEAQVERTPHAVAVTSDEAQVTYGELNASANRLARRLREVEVGPDVPVGLFVERSIDMVVGMLGILKAGAAYVPLDPEYPADHLALVLNDARVSVLVTQRHLIDRIPQDWQHALSVVALDAVDGQGVEPNLINSSRPEQLAYVMYTSGSAGRPKGVMVAHRNLVHSTNARLTFYRERIETFLLLPSFAFDGSVAAIFWTLCSGGRLALPPPGTERDPSLLARLISRVQASHVLCVSSLYAHILDRATPRELASVRAVIVGGEVCPAAMIVLHREKAPHALLFNEYGPTECTVWSSVCEVSGQPADLPVPIGRPIANTQMYILDAELQPMPIGVPGELHIGGDGVARGYLNRPDLTSARFIPSPFSDVPGARLYKTGDLAKYRADGQIEFLGRLDHQVKIRGFRVEPEELEAVLVGHGSVRAAVVAAVENSQGTRLVAYIVGEPGQEPTAADLRRFLRRKLPNFMIPARFVFLESLPTTASGKVDRRALPPLPQGRSHSASNFEPLQPLERQLQRVWEEVLGVQPIGLDDNFFELGGHSLLAIELLSKVEGLTDKKLRLASLLETRTIRELAALLRQTERPPAWSRLVAVQPSGSKPPFFCVAGGGSALGYQPLARHLGQDQPLYALDAAGLDGESPDTRIEDMAARYTREIRRRRPDGPYFIGGHSFGGLIAFEIAQQLLAQGQPVALLVLFDTFNPGYVSSLSTAERRNYRAFQVQEKARFHLKKLLSDPRRWVYARQRAGAAVSIFKFWLWQLAQRSRHARKPELLRVLDDVAHANRLAYKRYTPRTYSGPLTLFRASVRGIGDPLDPLMGWGRLVANIQVYRLPGDHGSMLSEPHVRDVANRLTACFDQAAQSCQAASASGSALSA